MENNKKIQSSNEYEELSQSGYIDQDESEQEADIHKTEDVKISKVIDNYYETVYQVILIALSVCECTSDLIAQDAEDTDDNATNNNTNNESVTKKSRSEQEDDSYYFQNVQNTLQVKYNK